VLGPVLLQPLVDLVGQPEQRQLAQRGQVPRPEVVGERRVDFLRRVDVAVRHPPAQRLGGHVDELYLVGGPHHGVGYGLPLRHPGDLLDDVVERLQVLDVDRGDHVDAGVEQLLDVLPALFVARAGHVGMRELVDQRDLRLAGEHRVGVHLLERGAAVRQLLARDDLEPVEQRRGLLPRVRLSERDDDIRPALAAAVPLAKHGVRLPHTRGGAQVNPQLPAWRSAAISSSGHTSNSAATYLVTPTPLTPSMHRAAPTTPSAPPPARIARLYRPTAPVLPARATSRPTTVATGTRVTPPAWSACVAWTDSHDHGGRGSLSRPFSSV